MSKPDSKGPPPGSSMRKQADGSWTSQPGPQAFQDPEHLCRAILDAETQRRCKAPVVPDNDGYCHVHGPNAKEWHRKGGKAGGAVRKKLWDDRKKQANCLAFARTWEGYLTLGLAALKDEYDAGAAPKNVAALMQRIEKALEHVDRDDIASGDVSVTLKDPDASGL